MISFFLLIDGLSCSLDRFDYVNDSGVSDRISILEDAGFLLVLCGGVSSVNFIVMFRRNDALPAVV